MRFQFTASIRRGSQGAVAITTEDMPTILAECGKSHWTGAVVRYHCFPIPE